MKKSILIVLVLFAISGHTAKAVNAAPQISAKCGIVYQADTGRVLYEKQADDKMLIASVTKIMTALAAIENCDLDNTIRITREMAEVEGSSMYLQVGETYTLRELLYGLLLASGNDAATAIAVQVAGDTQAFVALMNEKAKALGMKNTSFENPHGLDGDNHYSTARDLAVLAAYAMKNDTFAEIVGTRHITIKNLTYVNHNKLLWQCEGVTGIKTGYTMAAGRTLVTCCQRNGQTLICVTLSARDDWNDHKKLYDWAYGTYERRPVLGKEAVFEVPIMTGRGETVTVHPQEDVTVFAADTDEVSYCVELPRFVFGPVVMGAPAGRIVVSVNGVVSAEMPLVYMESFELKINNPSKLNRLIQKVQDL